MDRRIKALQIKRYSLKIQFVNFKLMTRVFLKTFESEKSAFALRYANSQNKLFFSFAISRTRLDQERSSGLKSSRSFKINGFFQHSADSVVSFTPVFLKRTAPPAAHAGRPHHPTYPSPTPTHSNTITGASYDEIIYVRVYTHTNVAYIPVVHIST